MACIDMLPPLPAIIVAIIGIIILVSIIAYYLCKLYEVDFL
jgi:hypothetical protein